MEGEQLKSSLDGGAAGKNAVDLCDIITMEEKSRPQRRVFRSSCRDDVSEMNE